MTTFVISPAYDYSTGEETYTVTATRDEPYIEVKSCQWRTVEAAQAEARRIRLGWEYGTGAVMGERGVA